MLKVSATKLRTHLFEYLDKVVDGETIIIERNKQEIARIAATRLRDWREGMTIKPQILVSPEELIKPLDDLWEEYL